MDISKHSKRFFNNNTSLNNEDLPKIVLVGNPNVGKSVFFNKFTGTYVEVSNYPGTTVDVSKAMTKQGEVIDTPGIYGIGSFNDEETVARDIIFQADIIINVVSALSLERDLFLTQQLIDYGFKVIVVINQFDEAKGRGIQINTATLEELLGVKVFITIATKNIGIEEVKNNIDNAKYGNKTSYVEDLLLNINENERLSYLSQLEENLENRDTIYSKRRIQVNNIVENSISETTQGLNISTNIGKALLNPFIGSACGVFILFLLYKIIGVFIAGNLVNFLEKDILIHYYIPFISNLVSKIFPSGALHTILVGEFGLLTMTIQYIIGVLLPLVIGFNIFMAILEDTGYLSRLAVITDKFLSKIGLNGRAVIPLILGFGCVTMATITTRILGSKRERTIATTILGLTIPCSAQLGIIIGLIAVSGGLLAWTIYLLTIFIVLVTVGTVLNKYLPGKSSYLLIDLPPMRLPVLKNVLDKTYSKTIHFLEEATPLFFLGSFLITMLKMGNGITFIEKILAPLTVNVLHLPAQTATIFIMGLIRRDFGAAGLAGMAGVGGGHAILSPMQVLVSLVVITLFVPCLATVFVMYKERGFKEASFIWLGSWVAAFLTGGILSMILRILM